MKKRPSKTALARHSTYKGLISGIGELLEAARHASVRVVNAFMTATYWETGRRIVEFEQGGKAQAEYGKELLARLARDLTTKHGRGFSQDNLENMRRFYLAFPPARISETVSRKSIKALLPSSQSHGDGLKISETLSRKFSFDELALALPLPWSHYVLLVKRSRSPEALDFYHAEALRGGWSVRQLDRQFGSLFYERTALSRDKAAMLKKGARTKPGDALTADEAVKDPLVLEFLGLRDEYSETELEDALVRHLETFLLELGGDFAFVGRQRRLRIGGEWYRVDLLFFHRRLRCLVVIDLKLEKFTHADAGQMHLYLNYAREHWTHAGENPPVGLILCSSADAALVRYTLDNLPSKILAREYQLALPGEKRLAAEMEKARREAERRNRRTLPARKRVSNASTKTRRRKSR